MNISISTTALAAALRSLEKATPAKAVLPILSHVLVRAELGQAQLSCTDTELSLTRTLAASVQAPGIIALPCKPLLDIVSQITEPDVHIIVEKAQARIASGQFKMRMQTQPADAFPALAVSAEKGTLLNGAALRALIRKVRPCISASEKRYNINGALLVMSQKVTALVATDGKRLSVATMPGTAESDSSVILPTGVLDTLLQDDADDYSFSVGERQMFFSSENAIMSSRMVEGQFPNYQRTIPTTNPHTLSVARDVMLAALKRVSLVANDTRTVRLEITQSVMTLHARSLELGDATEHVAISYTGDDTQVNLQSIALLDFLDAARNASVTIALGGSTSAALLSDGSDFITVAMAVRA